MGLSNKTVSQFVKITNDNTSQKQNGKLYGTAVIYDNEQYVQIDGSDLLTPADSTVHIKNGERVTVSIDKHTALIDGNVTDVSASNQQVINLEEDLVKFRVDAEGMFLDIRDEMDDKFANYEFTLEEMRSEIGKKVDGEEVKTIVVQNAESWNLSIDGKLYGTNYRFDGENFSIGSTTGGTTAYHAPGYSKWVHSDGSWTQVDPYGMTWSKGSTTTGYHCLLYAGEYISNSEATTTIYLPEEFKGKPFKVVTSVKRIYVDLLDYIENARFPLLSFYAESRNVDTNAGTFQIYASVRAWNRTGYGGWGTWIGNNTTEAEASALKPVVAYWAFV